MNEEKVISNDWCKDFIEVLIKENNKPFDSWATMLGIHVDMNNSSLKNKILYYVDGVAEKEELERDDYIIDFYYKKKAGEEFYFSLTQREYDIFKKADSKSAIRKINFLSALRQIMVACHKEKDSLEMSWVKSEMLNYTPPLEFKSESQIKLLEKSIARIGALIENKKVQENFDVLKNQKAIIRFDNKAHKDIGDPVKGNATAADIIRYLLLVIEKFNPNYKIDRLTPMLWLNFLFLDVSGYSLGHIQKAPQRKS